MASVTGIRLDNALLAEAARLLMAAGTGHAEPEASVDCARRLLLVVGQRSAPDPRKGNPNGGPGRTGRWMKVTDEQHGTRWVRGMGPAAKLMGMKEANLRAYVSRQGQQHSKTREGDGTWILQVRYATETEAAELDAAPPAFEPWPAERSRYVPGKTLARARRHVVEGDG